MTDPTTLDFYAQPSGMTSAGLYTDLLKALPHDKHELSAVIRNILLNEHASQRYGVSLSDEARESRHIRTAEQLLEAIVTRDDRPLTAPRDAHDRVVGNCRQFAMLTVAALRAQGVPARLRVGFAVYIVEGFFEEHWIAEFWDRDERRWRLFDSQLDTDLPYLAPIDFDIADLPRDQFVAAGEAWRRCRAGRAEAVRFGFSINRLVGMWFIAGSVIRDGAALNKIEMLPWDGWGVMPGPNEPINADDGVLLDRLAVLTQDPDPHFVELRSRYRDDDRLRVPPVVHNHLRGVDETIG